MLAGIIAGAIALAALAIAVIVYMAARDVTTKITLVVDVPAEAVAVGQEPHGTSMEVSVKAHGFNNENNVKPDVEVTFEIEAGADGRRTSNIWKTHERRVSPVSSSVTVKTDVTGIAMAWVQATDDGADEFVVRDSEGTEIARFPYETVGPT